MTPERRILMQSRTLGFLSICIAFAAACSWLTATSWGDDVTASSIVRDTISNLNTGSGSDAEKKKAFATLVENEEWMQQVWENLSRLAVQARFDYTKLDELTEKLERNPEQFQLEDTNALDAEWEKKVPTTRAKSLLCSLLRDLERVSDARVISLIGPLLLERDRTRLLDDAFDLSIQRWAANTISRLATRLKLSGVPETSYNKQGEQAWREWWEQSKERFGPVRVLPPVKTVDGNVQGASIGQADHNVSR